MSSDQQVITSQNNSHVLNIPQASSLVKANEEKRRLAKVELIKQQSQIIETAFKEVNDDQCDVVIELENPLVSELWNELSKQGYNIYQSMSYDSTDIEHHSGKYKVTIIAIPQNNWEGQQIINQMRKEMNDMISAFKLSYRPYPSLYNRPYLPWSFF